MSQKVKEKSLYRYEVERLLAPYRFLLPLVSGKKALDLGCGQGRGANLLADYAKEVVAVDISNEIISRNKKRYADKDNLIFREMNAEKLKLENDSFDIVISFEVIEHVDNPDIFLEEIKRVLKPFGLVFLTTPNKRVRLLPLQKPWNPGHKREYYLREFQKELESVFPNIAILGIFGRGDLHNFFLRKQKQNPLGVYGTMIFGPRITDFVKSFFGEKGDNYTGKDRQILQENSFDGRLGSKQSPVVLKDSLKSCLNFFAICALDKKIDIKNIKKLILRN